VLKASTTWDRAAELEQEATRYPDERAEILLEAASAWKEAGEPKRAVAVWNDVVSLGGEEAGYARYSLANLCFEQGRDAEAWEHLRALEAEAPPDAGPCGLVAELLAERGEDEAALRWFNRAIGALGTDQVAAVGEPGGPPSLDASLFFGRQRVRRRLGLPADEWDRVADVAQQNRLDFVRLLERAAQASARPAAAGATMLADRGHATVPGTPSPERVTRPRDR
jgi:tetratricopeptide (TPR) repeat protein